MIPVKSDLLSKIVQEEDKNKEKFNGCSLNLTINRILIEGKEKKFGWRKKIRIHPQQMFTIVSKERINFNSNEIYGVMHPYNSLCNEGVLIFNNGIVDPGFHANLSTIALNFSQQDIILEQGAKFARVRFVKSISPMELRTDLQEQSEDEYVEDRRQDSKGFPQDFNEAVKNKLEAIIVNKLNDDTPRAFKLMAYLAALATCISFGLLTGTSFIDRIHGSYDDIINLKHDDIEIKKRFEQISEKITEKNAIQNKQISDLTEAILRLNAILSNTNIAPANTDKKKEKK